MIYLHDDSNYVLSQMLEPLKPKTEIDQKQLIREIKGEIVEENTTKKKKKVDQAGIHGHNPSTFKLDLKNSLWWKPGFDNSYYDEHLKKN